MKPKHSQNGWTIRLAFLQWNHLQALPSASWERWVETLFLSCIFLGLG